MRRQNTRRVILSKQPAVLDRKKDLAANAYGRGVSPHSVYQVLSQRPNDPLRILVIRSLGGIGDVLMTTPAVRQLKEDFPNAIIHYGTDRHSTKEDAYFKLLQNAPFVDEVIDCRYMDRKSYDAVVDITSVCIKYENASLPPLNRIDIFARACGIPRLRNPLPFYQVEPDEQVAATKKLSGLVPPGKKTVFLHTASFDVKRCWPVERYSELVEQASAYSDIHFLVSDFNNVFPNRLSYSNCSDVTSPSIRGLAAVIEQADLFVGPDSGPMHLAGALSVPGLALFGPIPPEARLNYYPTLNAVVAPQLVCGKRCYYAKCNYSTRCMSDITAGDVLNTIKEKLKL